MCHLLQVSKEGGDAVRASEADRGIESSPIARTMRSARRIPPRSYRPEPPKAGKTPATTADRQLTRQRTTRAEPQEAINATTRPSFSTE